MTAPVSTGLLALPYHWNEVDLEHSSRLLDEFQDHPTWLSLPMTAEERRRVGANILTNPDNRIWGVWRGEDLLGVLVLSGVVEGLNATLHFLFLDHNLVGKRSLLERFLGYCFATLKFRRISAEVPEDANKLLRFYRTLGFRFEGEGKAQGVAPVASAVPSAGRVERPATTIAKLGSRVDGIFWRDDRWIDVIRLRLLREEWEQTRADQSRDRSRRSPPRGWSPREPVRGREDDSPTPAGPLSES